MISTFMELVKEILSANIFANIGFGLYIIAFLRAEISRLRDDDDIMNMSHYMVMAASCLLMEAGFNLSNTSEMNLYLHFIRVVSYILGIIFVLFEVLIRANRLRRENEYFKKFNNGMSIKELKKRGTLVETLPKGTDFYLDVHIQYKECLGTVFARSIAGNIPHVYVAYRDYDDTIKYYDYPGYTKRDIRRRRKAFEKKRKNDCGERNN